MNVELMGALLIVTLCLFIWMAIQYALIRQRQRGVYDFLMLMRGVLYPMSAEPSAPQPSRRSEWPTIIALVIVLIILVRVLVF